MNGMKEYKLKGKLTVSTLFRAESKTLKVWIHNATGLGGERKEDPELYSYVRELCSYVRVYLMHDKQQRQETTGARAATDPVFEEEFVFEEVHNDELGKYKLRFKMYNSIFSQKDELLGDANIFLSSLKRDQRETFTLDILKKKSKVSVIISRW